MIAIFVKGQQDVDDTIKYMMSLPFYRYAISDTLVCTQSTRRSDVKNFIQWHPKEPIYFYGHGSQQGLFQSDWKDYLIDESMVPFLKDHQIVCQWCFACSFGYQYGLTGFFTDMFISNYHEALYNINSYEGTAEHIESLNRRFASELFLMMASGIPMSEWKEQLIYKHRDLFFTDPVVKFNYEGLVYMEKGE